MPPANGKGATRLMGSTVAGTFDCALRTPAQVDPVLREQAIEQYNREFAEKK